MSDAKEIVQDTAWKTKVLVGGVLIGAVTGLLAAYMLTQRTSEEEGFHMNAGEGVKLGVAALAFLRQVTQLGD
jgi:hypothetical protein